MASVAFNTVVQGAPIQIGIGGAQGPRGVTVWSLTPPTDTTVTWGDLNDGSLNSWNGTVWVSQGFATSGIPTTAYSDSAGSVYTDSTGSAYTPA